MDLGRKRISVCFFRGSFRKSSRWSTWEGVFSAQLILQARASSKRHEETLSATFSAEVSLSRVICPVRTRTLLLAPRPTSHIALSAKTPPPTFLPHWGALNTWPHSLLVGIRSAKTFLGGAQGNIFISKKIKDETTLVVQWLRFTVPNAGGPGLSPGQGTRSHVSQLRPSAAK